MVTEKGKVYAESEAELETLKKKREIKIKEIQRNKGLGEMSPEAWKFVLNRDSFTKIMVKELKKSKRMLEICFGKDTALRKDLLIDE